MGVAVASGSAFVGDRVPYAKPGIGVIATQAYTKVMYGTRGLELLANGLRPQETLSKLLRKDFERDFRQVAIMDFKSRKATFTGANVPEYYAESIGENHVVIGNLLSRKEVVSNMSRQFEISKGGLAYKMSETLKVGRESGGDKRGEKSAALIVVGTTKVEIEIKVDLHENPIEELFRKLKSQ
jgi:uncharacterized Ntn-hydrolase superfamily protein